MTIFELSSKVKQVHSSNDAANANYIANLDGDIIEVLNIDEHDSTDCYCFKCEKAADGTVLIKLI